MQFPSAKILIFAKAPDPGLAKTRLAPAMGEFQAAKLAEALLRHAVCRTLEAQLAPVDLYCTPDVHHPAFKALDALPDVAVYAQAGGDLGARMRHALQQALTQSDAVLLMGTDTPSLDAEHMRQALQSLYRSPSSVCISPAEDGGYALLGLAQDCQSLFVDMPWGGAEVLSQTLSRCRQAGRPVVRLPEVWDIDRPDDLDRLRTLGGWDQHLPSE